MFEVTTMDDRGTVIYRDFSETLVKVPGEHNLLLALSCHEGERLVRIVLDTHDVYLDRINSSGWQENVAMLAWFWYSQVREEDVEAFVAWVNWVSRKGEGFDRDHMQDWYDDLRYVSGRDSDSLEALAMKHLNAQEDLIPWSVVQHIDLVSYGRSVMNQYSVSTIGDTVYLVPLHS